MKRLLLALSFVMVISCSPDKESPQAVPAKIEDIQKAQGEAFGSIRPQDIQAGEFVYTITSQQIFSSQEPAEALLQEDSMTMIEKLDMGDYYEFTAIRERIDHTQPDSPKYKFKDVLYVGKEESASVEEPPMEEPPVEEIPPPAQETPADTADTAEPTIKVEYFNLKTSSELVRKPQKVLERDPCNEADGSCLITIQKITYDIRVTVPDEVPRITSVELWISQEVPYLAAVLKNCFKTVITIESARPLIQQCTTVMDYKFQ